MLIKHTDVNVFKTAGIQRALETMTSHVNGFRQSGRNFLSMYGHLWTCYLAAVRSSNKLSIFLFAGGSGGLRPPAKSGPNRFYLFLSGFVLLHSFCLP